MIRNIKPGRVVFHVVSDNERGEHAPHVEQAPILGEGRPLTNGKKVVCTSYTPTRPWHTGHLDICAKFLYPTAEAAATAYEKQWAGKPGYVAVTR